MARETLKNFLRSGRYPRPNENPDGIIQYTLEDLVGPTGGPDSSGLAFEFNTGVPLIGFDAADPDVGLIGNFLHFVSKRSGNFYEFNKGNKETFAGRRGQPLIDSDTFIADEPFIPQGTIEDSLLGSYSNSKYFDDPSTEGVDELERGIISKIDGAPRPIIETPGPLGTITARGARGANNLLGGVRDNGDEDFLVQATVSAFKKNSRFNMDEEFYENPSLVLNSDVKDEEGNPVPLIDNEENYQFVRDEEDFYTSLEALKNAGASLMMRASGYDISENPNDPNVLQSIARQIKEDRITQAIQNELSVRMPVGPDSGVDDVPKITEKSVRPRNATGVPKKAIKSVRSGKGSIGGNASSFGVSYNNELRFEDFTTVHKVKAALRVITLYSILDEVYQTIIKDIEKEDKKEIMSDIKKIASSTTNGLAGEMLLGLSRKSNKFIIHNFLFDNFLTPTDFSYKACFERGLEVVLGSKEPTASKESVNHMNNVYESPGFWLAVSNAAIKKTFLFTDTLERLAESGTSSDGRRGAIREIAGSLQGILKIANIFAIIGEKSLHYTNGLGAPFDEKRKNIRDVDSLDNIPGNRVGKSRKKKNGGKGPRPDIGSATTLAWEQSDVPSAYLLPLNILRAAADLNNAYTRVNPLRGMVGSRLVRNTYTGLDTDGTGARIPERVVKILEDRLDAEYVPFYIQDLRTNEIVAFHAFLSQLTDSITPNFTSTPGYGRIDPVQTYQSTTRSIQVGFTVYSTNREDFDDMWYKINKFVTLLYPQWTQGEVVQVGDPDKPLSITESTRFVQPFTQKIGASPIVRLRIGDVIKSNYSRFSLARTFGIGDPGIKANPIGYENIQTAAFGGVVGESLRKWRDLGITIFATVFGSPQGLLQILSDKTSTTDLGFGGTANAAANVGFDLAAEGLAEILINGFVNPLLALQTLNRIRDPNFFESEKGFDTPGFVYLNPNMIDGYHVEGSNNVGKVMTSKRILCRIIGTVEDEVEGKFKKSNGEVVSKKPNKLYRAEVLDKSDEAINKKILHVAHKDIWNDPSETFIKSAAGITYVAASADVAGALDILTGFSSKRGGTNVGVIATDLAAEFTSLLLENPESAFMRPEFNPYVRSFHSTRGRGLAGVIKGVSFNWLDDFPWETDHNARAPIGCNINFSFDVIHDIPPGLDHTGYNRAPLYNVGEIMRNVSGDVYDEKFSKSERNFREGGSTLLSKGVTAKKRG